MFSARAPRRGGSSREPPPGLELFLQAHVFGQDQDLFIAYRQQVRALRCLAVGDLVAKIVEVIVQSLVIQLAS
jgi:hypothetical protein